MGLHFRMQMGAKGPKLIEKKGSRGGRQRTVRSSQVLADGKGFVVDNKSWAERRARETKKKIELMARYYGKQSPRSLKPSPRLGTVTGPQGPKMASRTSVANGVVHRSPGGGLG
jgi:hypothetical protein